MDIRTLVLTSVCFALPALAGAQSVTPVEVTPKLLVPGMTWSGGAGLGLDSLSLCESPSPRAVRRPVRAQASLAPKTVMSVAPKARPAAPQGTKLPAATPKMLCPRIHTGPRFIGAPVAADLNAAVPMGEEYADVENMPYVDQAPPVAEPPALATATTGGRGFRPFGWIAGGGAIAFFSAFTHGGKKEPSDKPPRVLTPPGVNPLPNPGDNPEPPNPPNPEPPTQEPPPVTSTPEPATLALLGTGLIGLAGAVKQRKRG